MEKQEGSKNRRNHKSFFKQEKMKNIYLRETTGKMCLEIDTTFSPPS